jgi:hypothetical protein
MVPLLAPMAVIGVTSLGRKWNEKNVLTRRYRYIAIGIVVFFLVIWAYQIIADLPIYIQLLSPDGNLHGISY